MLRSRTLVAAAMALVLMLLSVPGLNAASTWTWLPEKEKPWYNAPRVSIPNASLMNGNGSDVEYVWRGGDVKGHRMRDHQYDVRFYVSSRFEAGYDRHQIRVRGDNEDNWFGSRTSGWWARYGWKSAFGPVSLFVEHRGSHGETLRDGDLRVSPGANTNTLGAAYSRIIGDKTQIHLLASTSKVDVGSGNAWNIRTGAGLDYKVIPDVTAQASANLYFDTGDVSATRYGLVGGLHYEGKLGITADVFGAYLPSGAPLAGDPSSDAATFSLDPAFTGGSINNLGSEPIGYYTLRVGYVTRF